MLKIHQLPEDYIHPSGINMAGMWACSELKDGQRVLICCDKSKASLLKSIGPEGSRNKHFEYWKV